MEGGADKQRKVSNRWATIIQKYMFLYGNSTTVVSKACGLQYVDFYFAFIYENNDFINIKITKTNHRFNLKNNHQTRSHGSC